MTKIYFVLFLSILFARTATAGEKVERAKMIFTQYVTLAGKFAPAVADRRFRSCGSPSWILTAINVSLRHGRFFLPQIAGRRSSACRR
jgi:hypothetical protein